MIVSILPEYHRLSVMCQHFPGYKFTWFFALFHNLRVASTLSKDLDANEAIALTGSIPQY